MAAVTTAPMVTDEARRRHELARQLGVTMLLGPAIALVWAALTNRFELSPAFLVLSILPVFATGLVMLTGLPERVTNTTLEIVTMLACVMLSVGMVVTDLAESAAPLFYLWVTSYVFVLLSRRRAYVTVGVVAVCYGVAINLASEDTLPGRFGSWLVVVSSVLVVGLLARRLAGFTREAETLFEDGFVHAVAPLFVTQRGVVTRVNPAGATLLDTPPEDLFGSRLPFPEVHDPNGHLVLFGAGEHARVLRVTASPIRGDDDAVLWAIYDVTELVNAEEEIRQLSQRLTENQDAERRRIAEFLHDDALQSLAAARMRIELLSEQMGAEDECASIKNLIAHTSQALRGLVFDLHPVDLRDRGLVTAVDDYADRMLRADGIEVTLDTDRLPELAPSIQIGLFRIAQEALANVRRHAQADRVTVAVRNRGAVVELTVADDGVGYAPDESAVPRLGTRTMRDRAQALGGTVDIVTPDGGGTTVCARIPHAPTGAMPAGA